LKKHRNYLFEVVIMKRGNAVIIVNDKIFKTKEAYIEFELNGIILTLKFKKEINENFNDVLIYFNCEEITKFFDKKIIFSKTYNSVKIAFEGKNFQQLKELEYCDSMERVKTDYPELFI
jgi:hypothetical protein